MTGRTEVFFVVSSGRSGTAMLQQALAGSGGVEMHHEYMVHIVQPLAVRRYLGLVDAASARDVLARTHAAAIHYCEAGTWGDSSNKLSWLIPELAQLIPRAKFVHLMRDGRKVAGSYFRKLGDECYDDRSTAILQAHYDEPAVYEAPPPEKRYWWPVPRANDPMAGPFRAFDQFARIAWHWAEINRVILEGLDALPERRAFSVRLEDLHNDPRTVERLFAFLGLAYRREHFDAFARPHNVNRPQDRKLDARERAIFDHVAGQMMERLGYAGSDEYVVKY